MGLALASLVSLGAGLCGLLYSPLLLLVAPLALLCFRPSLGLLFGLLFLPFAFLPEMEGDSIMYQVPLAIRNLHYHKYLFSTDNIMSAFPGAFDSLLALMPEQGRLLNFLVLVACFTTFYRLSWVGILGIFALIASPHVWHLTASSKPDLLVVLFSLLGAIAWKRQPYLSGIMLGMGCMAKLSFAPIALCACALGGWKHFVGMGVVSLPWCAYLYLAIGTPAFPLLHSDFSLTFFTAERQEWLQKAVDKNISFTGGFNILFTSMPLAVGVACFSRNFLPVAGIVGAGLTMMFFPCHGRYILPVIPLLVVPGIIGLKDMSVRWFAFIMLVAISLSVGAFFQGHPFEHEQSYVGGRRMLQHERLLMIGEERKYPYFNPEGFAPGLDNPSPLNSMLNCENSVRRLKIRLKQKHITGILFYGRGLNEAEKANAPVKIDINQFKTWMSVFLENGKELVSIDLGPDAFFFPLTKRPPRERMKQEENK